MLQKISQKVDVWPIGVILYLMVYGKLPFEHIKDPDDLKSAICDPERKELTIAPIEKDRYNHRHLINVNSIKNYLYLASSKHQLNSYLYHLIRQKVLNLFKK